MVITSIYAKITTLINKTALSCYNVKRKKKSFLVTILQLHQKNLIYCKNHWFLKFFSIVVFDRI